MRKLQRQPAIRLCLALGVSAVVTFGSWRIGAVAAIALLFVALALIVFAALTIMPDAIALYRGHYWRWWWRKRDDEGPYWPGTRIPRAPWR